MSLLFFEQLDNSGLLNGNLPNASVLEKLSKKEIMDNIHQSIELTSATSFPMENTLFSQSASLSLSGGRTPCINIECRLKRARNLAQYAALYADKVYVYNILSYHISRHDEPDEEQLKADVFDDLVILGYLRPLIESGRITVFTPPEEFCPRCFAFKFAKNDFRKKSDSLYRWLSKKYLDSTQVEVEQKGSMYGFLVSGPEALVEHGTSVRVFDSLPDTLAEKTRIMSKIKKGEKVKLSRTVLERTIQLHKIYAMDILQNVFFELACSQCINTSFLTESEIHIDSLNYLSQDSISSERNYLIQKHLTSLVPFISVARIEDLLKLRDKEGYSFHAFRQAITKAVEEYKSSLNRPFGPNDARQLYGDVIEPDLSKLDQTIKTSTNKLLKGTAARVFAWAGAISFGCYAGFIPTDLVAAATTLGFAQVLADIGTPILTSRFQKEEAAKNDMYFLWRVRELSSH